MPTLAPGRGLSTLFWRQFHFAYQWLAANFRVFVNSYSLSFVSSHFLRLSPPARAWSGRQETRAPLLLRCSNGPRRSHLGAAATAATRRRPAPAVLARGNIGATGRAGQRPGTGEGRGTTRRQEKNLATFDDLDFNVYSNQKWDEPSKSHAADIVVHCRTAAPRPASSRRSPTSSSSSCSRPTRGSRRTR